VFFGPLLGPIIGGFLIMSDLTWRATFWFCFAFALFIFLLVFFLFPETYRIDSKFDLELPVSQSSNIFALSSSSGSTMTPQGSDDKGSSLDKTGIEGSTVVQHKQKNAPETSGPKEAKKSINPIAPFLLLRHPFILIASLASGIAFGSMFAVETIIPDLYETHYGFTSWKTGTIK
jgi:MFS family permease